MIKILKRLICNHRYIIFIKNIYGDEINALSTKKTIRSIWKCIDCGKIIYSDSLYNEE